MKAVFKFELDDIELERINLFCKSACYYSIEQSIGWSQIFYKSKFSYFYLIEDDVIKSFSQISENLIFAEIIFGPVCSDKDLMITSINEIIKYYKRRRFVYLGIQMYYKSSYDTEYIEYAVNKLHNVKYIFDNENTKSSIEINLEESIEEIYGRIRKGHKSDIKKAIKLGLTVDIVKNLNDLNNFIGVYSKMCKARHIDEGNSFVKNKNEVYNYLIRDNKGQILIAKDDSGTVVGGAIFVNQGISVRYLKGATDPERRDIPMLHLVLYEAIKRAKDGGFKYFDFWGYNHFADEKDQVYYINHFKKGFGGYFTFFAKKMNINLFLNGYYIYKYFLFLKKVLKIFSFSN